MPATSDRRRAFAQVVILVVAAAAWRLLLSGRYYGWEEGDYGNVMMIREVLDSRFTWFRTSHMPAWYSMGAVAQFLGGHPRGSALVMTLSLSSINVGVAALLARKLVSPAAGWLVGLWLLFQPEMALYGASTLRSPVFVSIAFAGMAFLVWGGRDRGFGLTSLAFLVRMEGFFVLYVPAAWSWLRDAGRGLRAMLLPAALLGGVLVGWQLYISLLHHEGFFAWAVLNINRAPDVHGEADFDWSAWVSQGLQTSWWLLTWTLPRMIGWTWWWLAALGGWVLWRGSARPGSRTLVAFGAFGLAFWLGEGFTAHHEPNHNLYWVWLLHAIPFLALLAAGGYGWIDRKITGAGAWVRAVAFLAILGSVGPAFWSETSYQMTRAEAVNRPQLELSTWIEENAPDDSGVLVSSIPEVWLKRKPSKLRVFSWWTLPARAQNLSKPEFGAFLAEQRIDYVVWFDEEWTDAPRIAPWMVLGKNDVAGPVGLTFVDRGGQEGYGWILYLVTRPDHPYPPVPPAFGSGARGRGWRGVQ